MQPFSDDPVSAPVPGIWDEPVSADVPMHAYTRTPTPAQRFAAGAASDVEPHLSGVGADVRTETLPGHAATRRVRWRWVGFSILLTLVGLASGLLIAPLAYSTPALSLASAGPACGATAPALPYGCGAGSAPTDRFVLAPPWHPTQAYWMGSIVLTNLDARRAFEGYIRLIGTDDIQCVNAPYGLSTWQVTVPRGGQITLACAVTNPPHPGGIPAHTFGGAWASRWPSAATAVLVQIDNPAPFAWTPH